MTRDNRDFDRIVRSLLEDGAEPLDGRVWKGISAKMSSAAAAARRRAVFLVLSGAAASVAALALLMNLSDRNVGTGPDGFAVRESLSAEASVPETGTSAELPAEFSAGGSGALLAAAGSAPAGFPAEVPAPYDPAESVHETETEEEGGAVLNPGTGTARKKDDAGGRADAPSGREDEALSYDVFAMTDREDPGKKKRGIGIRAGGGMMTNGNPASMNGRFMYRVDKGSSSSPLITQTGRDASYAIPVTVGVTVEIPLRGRWSVESGVSYSFLERTFTGVYKDSAAPLFINGDIRHTLHYVGIPVNIRYGMVRGDYMTVQAYGGMRVERAVMEKYRIPDGARTLTVAGRPEGVQLSAGAGFSINFLAGRHMSVYLDPGLQYFFDCGQPVSIRTQQPFQMSIELGLRYRL